MSADVTVGDGEQIKRHERGRHLVGEPGRCSSASPDPALQLVEVQASLRPDDGFAVQHAVRLVFAVAMTLFLLLGAIAITRRDFAAHGAWMTRAFAIAVTGGTQALVVVLWSLPFGEVDVVGETWLVAAGFAINSVVAELLIRRRSGRRTPERGRGAL